VKAPNRSKGTWSGNLFGLAWFDLVKIVLQEALLHCYKCFSFAHRLNLGLIHTRHFCTQYCDKKIKRHFDKKIFFSSKYCNDISKYLESSPKNIFNTHREKSIGWKMSFYHFIAISFYRNIASKNV